MKLFYEIANEGLDYDPVGVKDHYAKYFWKRKGKTYYPDRKITEEEFHNLVVEWMNKEDLPEFSLDELDSEDFTEEQWDIRNFFMDLFDLISNDKVVPKQKNMEYSLFIFHDVFRLNDREYAELEYDKQFSALHEEYEKFEKSKYNVDTKSELDCIDAYFCNRITPADMSAYQIKLLTSIRQDLNINVVTCGSCGNILFHKRDDETVCCPTCEEEFELADCPDVF